MTETVSPEAEPTISDLAQRHGLSRESVLAMLAAVNAGGGTMAQFSIPELGGSGQWMRGGMTMVGNMFDDTLKARIDALCAELSQLLMTTPKFPASTAATPMTSTSSNWWPADFGVPSATGGQNDARYAIFPSTQRLMIQINGETRVFDTGEHRINGVQQQQGGRHGSVDFTSQLGTFDVSSLLEISAPRAAETPIASPGPKRQDQAQSIASQQLASDGAGIAEAPDAQAPRHHAAPTPAPPEATPSASHDGATIIATIEALAGLHQRGIVSDEEFASKKADLLDRL